MPMPPKVLGEFQMIRQALIRSPKRFAKSALAVWMAALWPMPLNMTIASALSNPSSTDSAFNMASTGDNFSRVSGSFGPTSLHSTMMMLVRGLTVKPARSAIHAADLPTISGFSLAAPTFLVKALTPNMYCSSISFSFLFA